MKLLYFLYFISFSAYSIEESVIIQQTMCNDVFIKVGYFSSMNNDNSVDFTLAQVGSQSVKLTTNSEQSNSKATLYINRGYRDIVLNIENDCSKKNLKIIDISSY